MGERYDMIASVTFKLGRSPRITIRNIAYHPQLVAVYHQGAEKCTPARDDIQPEGLMICTARCAAMICQACGLDKKIDKLLSKPVDFCEVRTKKIFDLFNRWV